jgi:DNA-binding NtrC family response regulator
MEPDLKLTIMNERNIIIFERYDGVRFVLERSLLKYKDTIDIFSSHWKNEIKNRIENQNVDLLITELTKANPDGFELTCFARKVAPELKIIWITVLGCDVFSEQRERLGNIKCIEKPLEIKNFRINVLQVLELSP